ncbi:MAG TPA: TetR/AcrR family transcriptional regulator [Acidimicrobiales bacterium]|nr:TetR/AcrR family transcriptional regulator [Acidimicrobiales bacterium]
MEATQRTPVDTTVDTTVETTVEGPLDVKAGLSAQAGSSGGTSGVRLTADERRVEVLKAAMAEFAQGGYAGTSTEAIANRAGISQPYLFRLFGTKRDLFVATMAEMHHRIERSFRVAASGKTGEEAMAAMGEAYKELLSERDLLLVQMHSFAGSSDPVIRKAAREGLRHLWSLTGELTGLPDEAIREFFAYGMLINVLAAVDADSLDESWVRACHPDAEMFFAGISDLSASHSDPSENRSDPSRS